MLGIICIHNQIFLFRKLKLEVKTVTPKLETLAYYREFNIRLSEYIITDLIMLYIKLGNELLACPQKLCLKLWISRDNSVIIPST